MEGLRTFGPALSPMNAFLLLQGVETLHLRMERHCSNALAVAEFLKNHRHVSWVRFPGLPDDPEFARSQKYLRGKGGSMVVFGIKGGRASGEKFIDSLRLFSHLANVGDARSLAIHSASTTHSQLSEEQQRAAGITPDLVRLSIGLEHPDDILADLDQALSNATA
jgi:O-acetylhomoserine (thiol)-lyase